MASKNFTLSVLDQSPVREGGTAAEALRDTIALAEATEKLGYKRFWVAEHHSLPGFAGTSPEIMVGQIAARTKTIRVGSGGVMLSHYSAFKVAEVFRMLDSLYPGRIDLGVGRAPGSDPRTAAALSYPSQTKDINRFPEQIDDVISYLHDSHDPSHPFASIRAAPTPTSTAPEVWLLGSGIDSASTTMFLSVEVVVSEVGVRELVSVVDLERPPRCAFAPFCESIRSWDRGEVVP